MRTLDSQPAAQIASGPGAQSTSSQLAVNQQSTSSQPSLKDIPGADMKLSEFFKAPTYRKHRSTNLLHRANKNYYPGLLRPENRTGNLCPGLKGWPDSRTSNLGPGQKTLFFQFFFAFLHLFSISGQPGSRHRAWQPIRESNRMLSQSHSETGLLKECLAKASLAVGPAWQAGAFKRDSVSRIGCSARASRRRQRQAPFFY